MNAFLWTVVFISVVNTLAILMCVCRGSIPAVTPFGRFMDAVITAGLGMWAYSLILSAR